MYSNFEELLRVKGVKIADVILATGISRSTLSDWKHGRYVPKLDKLQRLADYFGVSVEYLLNGREGEGYYITDETAQIAQEVFENRDLRVLFDAARDASPEDIRMAASMLKKFKGVRDD